MRSSHLEADMLEMLSEHLVNYMGLHFPRERWPDLMRGMEGIARDGGFLNVMDCADWVLSTPLSRSQVQFLATQLTIGETYFFRDPGVFETLRLHILPPLIEARDSTRYIRVWSAGCSTGEEAYSIAILLDQALPEPETWDISILATDINPQALEKGRSGCYGEWSFRNPPRWLRDNYFSKMKNGQYEIHSRLRKNVAFSFFNLAGGMSPLPPDSVDIIFCRNVLMYLAPQTVANTVQCFSKTLSDSSWLIVTPAEVSLVPGGILNTVNLSGQILHRKPPQSPGLRHFDNESRHRYEQHRLSDTPINPALQSASEDIPEAEENLHRLVLDLANKGELATALQQCEKAIASDRLDPGWYYLLATILEEQGQLENAVEALQRALYLNQAFVMAHFALGNLYRQLDRYASASRYLQGSLRLLSSYDRNEVVPESGGITAGRLMDMIQGFMSMMEKTA